MKKTTERDLQKSIAISDMFQLLSLLSHYPTPGVVEGLLNGSFAEDVIAILEELEFSEEIIRKFKTNFLRIQDLNKTKEELFSKMSKEYTRLFSHPKEPKIAIYETLFRHKPENGESKPTLFISPAAMDAERCYKKAGLKMSEELNEPSDHMAIELEFMMYLYLQQTKAIQEEDEEELKKREGEIKEFSDLHLQRWAKEFFGSCVGLSTNEVYQVFGELGSQFITKFLN